MTRDLFRHRMKGRICIFGEVLFDHFAGGQKVLGGAPFNVAWNLQAFGLAPLTISRVGDDDDGSAIQRAMTAWNMDRTHLQVDAGLPTGQVLVEIRNGEPGYEIVHPSAWDAIQAPVRLPQLKLLYHGSLALRDEKSRQSLEQVRSHGPGAVFLDVNLRPPWWRREEVCEWVRRADWVKLNQNELEQLCSAGPGANTAEGFLKEYGLQGLILTHGAAGAELLTEAGDRFEARPQGICEVVDTVGAGDAFSSVMLLGLNLDWPLADCLERAQSFASAVVGQRGATVRDATFYQHFIEQWK